MPRAKDPPRVKGPYSERGGTRFRIRVVEATGHRDVYFSTLREAQAGMKQAARELPQSGEVRWLGSVIDEHMQDKVQRGLCAAQSARHQRTRLRSWLADSLEEDIARMTPKRALAYYERLVETPTRKTGQPPTAATHRLDLNTARTLFRWAVRRGYLRENPFESVQPVGRPNRGKKQLRFDEAERFLSAGFRMFDEKRDAVALAAVTTLLLGCRANEVLHVRVRDLDCGGTRLWIAARDSEYGGKTHNAARSPDVPEVLRPRLLRLSSGKRPEDYLFGVTWTGKPKHRQILHVAVRRICVAAGVPIVCPHSLRGLWATAGVRSGALSHAVAAALGHGSFKVTAKHYVKPGTLDETRTERLVEMLERKPDPPSADSARVHAEQILSSLPAETLARLLELARRDPAGSDPA
ncbi:MAG: tyrosine-type recombinase/integrase [Polyangia bacterium]